MQASPDNDPAAAPPEEAYHPGPGWQRRFWLIFIGQSLSLLGSALTQFVLLWWITDTTGSVSALAIAGMAALLPHALLSPLAGTFADRYSRRMLMIVADTISAACMLVPTSFLPRAAGLSQMMRAVTMIAPAPLGALAMGVMPPCWALGIDVVTALAGIVPLLLLTIPQTFAAPAQPAGIWSEFRAGAHMVWSR